MSKNKKQALLKKKAQCRSNHSDWIGWERWQWAGNDVGGEAGANDEHSHGNVRTIESDLPGSAQSHTHVQGGEKLRVHGGQQQLSNVLGWYQLDHAHSLHIYEHAPGGLNQSVGCRPGHTEEGTTQEQLVEVLGNPQQRCAPSQPLGQSYNLQPLGRDAWSCPRGWFTQHQWQGHRWAAWKWSWLLYIAQ